jgi:uncharacterized membrane protein
MEDNSTKYAWSQNLGLLTGTLLLALGIFVLYARPEANKAIPVFMIVYGLFRLCFAIYQLYFKKKNTL